MAAASSPQLIIVTGPTGVGKTAVALKLAERLHTEIISADSMQVYKHLSIGTAKPTVEELRGIHYHLIDHVSPDTQYNLGWFLRDAEPHIARLHAAGKVPIACGGTGLYLRGLLYGILEHGPASDDVRSVLEQRMQSEGLHALHAELMRLDPNATHILPSDRQRILRALEVIQTTGKSLTELQTQNMDEPRYRAATFVLERPREELYTRINSRVDAMVELGLLEEVRSYLAAGYTPENPAVKALGYAEVIAHLRGSMPLENALSAMKQKSRNYAKRQLTWFRNMRETDTIQCSGVDSSALADAVREKL